MEVKILFLSLAILFLSAGAPVSAQKGSEEGEAGEVVVSVAEGAALTVECPLRPEAAAEWRLDGGAAPSDMRPGERAAGGALTARLHAPRARPHHAGLYSCSRDPHAQRIRVVVQPHAEATSEAEEELSDGVPVLYYDINRNLTINCSLTTTDKVLSYVWEKNGVTVEQVPELKDRYRLESGGATFTLSVRANEDDYGNYSCVLGAARAQWEVHGRPVARLPDHSNVVEGQKLKLQCRVVGRPYPPVTWGYNETDSEEASVNSASPLEAGNRVRFETNDQGVENGTLVIEAAQRSDAGVYWCRAGASADRTALRVKDMYAALWPFLGICAEVLVLCAIILVYEKRRTKPEMEDSDTDNHDQKKS